MKPSVFVGDVIHRRFSPTKHEFSYPLALLAINIEDINAQKLSFPGWSVSGRNLVSINPKHYFASATSIKDGVTQCITEHDGTQFEGSIILLTQPGIFGWTFNPVSFFMCFDNDGTWKYAIAEITNTPWLEKKYYCCSASESSSASISKVFNKAFHISPFLPMDLEYDWRFTLQNGELQIDMTLRKTDQSTLFYAGLHAEQHELTLQTSRWFKRRFIGQNLRVVYRIYTHALRLFLKRVPFYSHPKNQPERKPANEQPS